MKLKQPFLLLAGLIVGIGLSAQTVYVNSSTGNDATGDGSSGNPYKTFHKGYTMASSGGTLDLTGTFTWTDADETGDVATNGYVLGKNITIQGQGAGSTIIQADASPTTADRRIFTISSSYTITIKDVTLRHGYLASNGRGGAVYIGTMTTDVTIDGCILELNEANAGSYTYSYGGGAICYYNPSTSGGQLIINNSIIRNNTSANCWGGGIYCYRNNTGTGMVVVENTTISENTAANGTAISGYYGAFNIINSTITGNYSSYCMIMSNHGYGLFYMTNVTFAYNDLGASARGLYLEDVADIRIKNSILAQNKRTDNSIYDYYRTSGTLNESTNNIIEVQGISDFTNGVDGNIIGEQDCMGLSSTLADNGTTGISPTLALTANSVAINAGTNTANGSVPIPTTDQRGTARVDATDIGAYEFTGTPAIPEITVGETDLNGFSYIEGIGPSAAQSFTVSGINLVNDITIVPSTYYEVSDGGAYGSSVVLTHSGGTVTETTVYARLKAGYTAGTYNGTIDITTDCDEGTINLTGSVSSAPASTSIWTGSTDSDWATTTNWSGGIVPTNTWHALIPASASNWPEIGNSLASPATCDNLTIEAGAECTILSNSGLTVSGNITNNGTFNINSSASGEGSLLVSGSLSGTGTYNVQRYLSGSQWHLVSSPITNGVAGVFQDIWLRPYDESTNNFGEYIQPYQTPMPTGQGFSVWADANETRTFTGTINHGSIGALSLQLTGTAGANTGWNLMGNPYPSSIDWDAASGWSRTNIADAVYVWNSSQYSAYVGGIPVNGGSRYIAPGQGFFLQATNVGASVTMDNGIRLHNSVSFLKNTQSDPENTIRVQVSADGYQDENVIVIREADAFAYDPLVDAYKLPGSADAPQMHIEKDDFSELSIASFPHIQDIEDKVLNIDYALEGTHSLLWAHTCTENSPALIDQQTGQIIEPGSIYTFTASFSDMEDRFVFETDLLSIQDKLKELDVWEYNNTVFVKSNTNESQISVINMQGVEVYSNTGNTFNLNHLSPAMYVVKVKSGEQTRIEKIVIK